MDIAGIQNAWMGMALFDMWDATVHKSHKCHKQRGSPLVAAAAQAFENYIQAAEMDMGAQIAGVAMYALNPDGKSAAAISGKDVAPFLALNVMA